MIRGVLSGGRALLARMHARLRQTQQIYMVLVSVVIGLAGGLWAVAFRECIRLGQLVAWNTNAYSLDYIRGLPAWWKVTAPAARRRICKGHC